MIYAEEYPVDGYASDVATNCSMSRLFSTPPFVPISLAALAFVLLHIPVMIS
ncbi:hypothetical protein SCLCIDRAFT_1214018 [Scleroderma citrinum Foug A]|uniref:Uncharacterized protein n=1 Tax=Scleroderma citrinum Foug A TaxID=1036808 RepID=A0A0C3E5C7_9AGAM|nr:hypothetical protein SCLCIDRAFT_1214018 [Scleroderma citrinum Foug A]